MLYDNKEAAVKLYTVTRSDLEPGAQLAQSVHAAIAFVHEHRGLAVRWHEESNNLVCLSVRDEAELDALCDALDEHEVRYVLFHEPDFGNELTAIAVEPLGRRHLSHLPLALRRAA